MMGLNYQSLNACVVDTSGYHGLRNRSVALDAIPHIGIGLSGRGLRNEKGIRDNPGKW